MDYVVIYLIASTAICLFLTLTNKNESFGWKLFGVVTMIVVGLLGWCRFGGGGQ